MKKITIDGKTIEIDDYEAFKRFVDALVKIFSASKEHEEWPKRGDDYWHISYSVDSDWATYVDDDIDRFNKSIGNCYRTKAEAEEATKTGWAAYLQALERVNMLISHSLQQRKTQSKSWKPAKTTI